MFWVRDVATAHPIALLEIIAVCTVFRAANPLNICQYANFCAITIWWQHSLLNLTCQCDHLDQPRIFKLILAAIINVLHIPQIVRPETLPPS
jgi:hypothetical protein